MKKLFGTDGMRGEAGRFPLDATTIEIVGASLATRLKQKLGRAPLIVIGRDTRESGEWLEQALVTGASNAGAELKTAGVITTPGVAFLARTLPADAGVVISASHNVYRDNGIKIFAPSGRKLDDDTERLIEADILSQTNSQKPATGVRSSAPEEEVRALQSRYLKFLQEEIAHGLSIKGLTIVEIGRAHV